MERPQKVTVEHNGQRWNGHYLVDEDRLSISSAYGSKGVKLKPKDDPAKVAQKLMLEIGRLCLLQMHGPL